MTTENAMTTEPAPTRSDPSESKRSRPTWRGAAFAAAYGAIVATLGYIIGRGNLFWAFVVMIVIGVLLRFCAVADGMGSLTSGDEARRNRVDTGADGF